MKKTVTFFGMLLTMLLMCPTGVWAAGSGETTTQVPIWLCIPFAGLLLCIAVMPLIKATCSTYVDFADGNSICGGLWRRQGNRDSS